MRAYYYRNMDPKTCRELRFLDDLLIVTALCPVGAQELAGGHLYWDGPFFISKNKGQTMCLSLVIIVRWKTTMRKCIVFWYSVVDIIVDIIDSENCHILSSSFR